MPDLHIKVSKELFVRLKLLAEQGNMSLHDFVKMYLERLAHQDSHIRTSTSGLAHKNEHIKTSTSERDPGSSEDMRVGVDGLVQRIAELLEKRLTRKIQDQLNAYTSKVEQIAQKQAEIVERLETLEERVKKLEEAMQSFAKASEKEAKPEQKRQKPDKCEILRKELILFESEIYGKIRDRGRFFASLERDCGAVIIEGLKERLAVEKSYWQSFLSKVSKISVSDDEKIERELDATEYRLFKTLKESALLIFDTTKKQWVFVEQKSTSTTASTTSSSSKQRYRKREDDESWVLQYVDIE
jgi:hypothetical protein